LLATAAWPTPSRADDIQILRCRARGDSLQLSAVAAVAAPREQVWAVLTDYEHMRQFVPGIYRARRLRLGSEGPLVEVVGVGRVLWVNRYALTVLQTRESAPESLGFRAVAGDFRSMRGLWRLESSGAGRTRVHCQLEATPRWWMPDFLLAWAARGEFKLRMRAIGREAERRARLRR
jgi:ribosome-associated toxin RatA of RatAB toxin-antitoxin module